MQIERKSPLTGKVNVREIDVTQNQLDRWRGGELIQDAMPNLSADDREFLMTGYTPEDWAAMFGEDGEDGDEGEPPWEEPADFWFDWFGMFAPPVPRRRAQEEVTE